MPEFYFGRSSGTLYTTPIFITTDCIRCYKIGHPSGIEVCRSIKAFNSRGISESKDDKNALKFVLNLFESLLFKIGMWLQPIHSK